MSDEIGMKFVSDAKQMLADLEKIAAGEGKLKKVTTDTGKAVRKRAKDQATMAREAVKLAKKVEAPLETYKRKLGEIAKLHKAGAITEKTYRRATAAAWSESGMAAEKAVRMESALGKRRRQLLAAIIRPQEQYNAKMRDLNRLLRTGKMSQEKYGQAVGQVKAELDEQSDASKKAGKLGGITSLATGWLSVGSAIAAATTYLHDFDRAKEEAAQRGIESRRGMGSLAQLAKSPEHFQQLQAKARGLHLASAVETEAEGARVVFSLESAGAMNEYDLYKQMGASGLVQEPAVMGRATRTLMTSMGEKETGNARKIASKAFAASIVSPASAEQLLEASSKSGGSARALGFSDEGVLAATAVMATATGNAAEGGTAVASLLRSLDEKRGALKGEYGQMPSTLREAIVTLQAKKLSSEDLKKLLGRSEAVRAYRGLVQNLDTYDKAFASINQAQHSDEVGRRLAMHTKDPYLMAAKGRVQAVAKSQQSMRNYGAKRNISETYILDKGTRMREAGSSEAAIWANDKMMRLNRWSVLPWNMRPGEDEETTFLRSQTYGPGGHVNPRAKEFLDAAKAIGKAAVILSEAADKQAQVADRQADLIEQQTQVAEKVTVHDIRVNLAAAKAMLGR